MFSKDPFIPLVKEQSVRRPGRNERDQGRGCYMIQAGGDGGHGGGGLFSNLGGEGETLRPKASQAIPEHE